MATLLWVLNFRCPLGNLTLPPFTIKKTVMHELNPRLVVNILVVNADNIAWWLTPWQPIVVLLHHWAYLTYLWFWKSLSRTLWNTFGARLDNSKWASTNIEIVTLTTHSRGLTIFKLLMKVWGIPGIGLRHSYMCHIKLRSNFNIT